MPNNINFSKPFSKLLILALCLALVLALVACGNGQANGNGDLPNNGEDIVDPDGDEPIDYVSDTVKAIILEVVEVETSWANRVYFAEDEPDQPQHEDVRIDSIEYAGQSEFAESRAAVFLTKIYGYFDEWAYLVPFYVVIERTAGNDGWLAALGISYDTYLDKSMETIVKEVAYSLWDLEVSVIFDGYADYIGPGSQHLWLNEEHETVNHYEYEPVYNEGDYWLSHFYEGMIVLAYYTDDEQVSRVNSIDITRTDCETYRGIRVGATWDEVLAAYPDIHQEQYWGEDDHLWYNTSDYGMGVGMNLLFWFYDGKVDKISLFNMFN